LFARAGVNDKRLSFPKNREGQGSRLMIFGFLGCTACRQHSPIPAMSRDSGDPPIPWFRRCRSQRELMRMLSDSSAGVHRWEKKLVVIRLGKANGFYLWFEGLIVTRYHLLFKLYELQDEQYCCTSLLS
jgi:hypothetical protein